MCVCGAALRLRRHEGARATFLSATPISIVPVLAALAVPADAIAIATETVIEDPPPGNTPGLRVLHGDVRLYFVPEPDHGCLAGGA